MTEARDPAHTPAAREPMVVITGLNKHFGELHVLRDINLTIGKGEVVVVLGPSGSGKSTLCRTINRLEPFETCLLYTSPSPRDRTRSRMPSSA